MAEFIRKEGCAGWNLLSKGGADLTLQCNKKNSENCMFILYSATRDLARALSPHSRGCWSIVHKIHAHLPLSRLLLAAKRTLSAG